MKIVDIQSFKEAVNKLDLMAQEPNMPISVFNEKDSVSDKMKKFFDIADGNPNWYV